MNKEQMWQTWSAAMETVLEKHEEMRIALEGENNTARSASILCWVSAAKDIATLLADWKESYAARIELGDSLGYMIELTGDYLRAVMEILDASSTMSPRTLDMMAQGAAMTTGIDDAEWLSMIGIQP